MIFSIKALLRINDLKQCTAIHFCHFFNNQIVICHLYFGTNIKLFLVCEILTKQPNTLVRYIFSILKSVLSVRIQLVILHGGY